jgi:predicted transcriptional regulator
MHNDNQPYTESELSYPDTLRITVQSGESALDNAVAAAGMAERGEQPPATVSFESPSGLRQLLTDRRVEILETLLDESAESITALADRLDRSYSVVHDDVSVLAEYGIVKFRGEGAGQAREVFVPYETVEIDVTIRGKASDERVTTAD